MHDIKSGIGYMTMLKRRREEMQKQIDATPKPLTLHERIATWYNDLSEDTPNRAWTMREFRAIFGETPQRIGAALFDLGWTRKRMWRDDRPTARYWMKNH